MTYRVSRYNSSTPLPSWLHFDESNQRFIGTPVLQDFIDVNVTAQDSGGLSTTTDFTINVISACREWIYDVGEDRPWSAAFRGNWYWVCIGTDLPEADGE
ncbi:MAG: putative Ig domain-containing protein [Proteobacteria bacterium]|nr:putative Ig domain-containing protein [Pseudomonadota bacterium]